MELSDRLRARSLGVVALARAAGGSQPMRAEPLIAWALGDEVAADRLAEALPEGDPLRAFLEQNPQTVRRATRVKAASPAARSLWARQRAEANNAPIGRWLEDESLELPALANRLRAADTDANIEVAIAVAGLARTVAALASDALPPDSQAALKQRLEPKEGTHYHRLARYLLGLEEEAAVLSLAGGDSRRACEIAYDVGRKAELDQRLDDASDWYRAAVETGATAQGEHRLALEQLAAWHRAGKTLARLATEPRAAAEELD